MGHPRIHIIALVGAGAISSSIIFCLLLVYLLPELESGAPADTPEEVSSVVDDRSVPAAADPSPAAPAEPEPPDPFEEAVLVLNDSRASLTERRQAAFDLAAIGTDDALMELLLAASSANPFLKTAIADSLGEFDHPEARRLLEALLKDSEEMVGRAAIRSLTRLGDTAAVARIAEVLFDPDQPVSLRTEAALALGTVDHPEGMDLLLRATFEAEEVDESEPVFHHILEALAHRSFDEVSGFFRRYLAVPELERESRVAALEALGGGSGETASFLVGFLTDGDPEIRRAAAWSLTVTSDVGGLAGDVFNHLQNEPDPDVRASLYRSLQGQVPGDAETLVDLVRQEEDPRARLAGLDLLASAIGTGSALAAVEPFNTSLVPELTHLALQGGSLQDKMGAIIALRRARTPEAHRALREIAERAEDARVVEAASTASQSSLAEPFATMD